ncbi:hypothetical protein GCM10027271_59130 [Saccharopolyspora gloriosae]
MRESRAAADPGGAGDHDERDVGAVQADVDDAIDYFAADDRTGTRPAFSSSVAPLGRALEGRVGECQVVRGCGLVRGSMSEHGPSIASGPETFRIHVMTKLLIISCANVGRVEHITPF